MAERISGENFSSAINGGEKPVLVDFYSDSCVPCKRLSPVLAEIEEEYSDKVKVYKINVAQDTETALQNDVEAVPTLLFFKDGKEVERLRGAVSKKKIAEIIDSL